MTALPGVGPNLTQQLYQKLFDRLNLDGDEAVTLKEMTAAGEGNATVSKVFETLDRDRDSRISKAEMTPSDTFGAETLAALIGWQTGPEALSDEEYLADWFSRTDTNADGLVSKDERQAAADLRRAAAYDSGYSALRAVMASPGANPDGALTVDQFRTGTLGSLVKDVSKVRFVEDGPPELLERMNGIRARSGQPPLTGPLTDAERQRRLDQLQADIEERNFAPDGTHGFLNRELGDMRSQEAARIAESDLSAPLAAQLLQRVLAGWTPLQEATRIIV